MSQDHDTLLLQAALRKELISPEEGHAAAAEAQRSGRDVGAVLVEQGLITERTRSALVQDVARSASARVATRVETGVEATRVEATRVETAVEATVAHPGPGAMPAQVGIYEVLEKLGQGGMGAVYKARDKNLHREVALKVLAPNVAADREMAERFLREARAAAAINHPNVITVHGAGEDGGLLYMALEFLPGGDADRLAARHGGRLPERLALEVLRDCAQGLVAVERAGLVHRDLKPANIFIGADGRAKLADLGLARRQLGDDRMTQTGAIVGTPAYMAPEQARGETELDIRTDIYALGASLYGLLTGKPPFSGSSAFVVVSNLLNQPAPDPRGLRPDLSERTVALVLRAMAKDRERRQQSAALFLAEIEAALAAGAGGAGGAAAQTAIAGVPGAEAGEGTPSWWARRATWQKVLIVLFTLWFLFKCCIRH
ncbi:MAG: serine/threonine-protein kinase [Planctomycetota bacterium]